MSRKYPAWSLAHSRCSLNSCNYYNILVTTVVVIKSLSAAGPELRPFTDKSFYTGRPLLAHREDTVISTVLDEESKSQSGE